MTKTKNGNGSTDSKGRQKKVISYEKFMELTSDLKTLEDVTEMAKQLLAPTVQGLLEAELEQHLGYPKNHISGINSGNSRNGHRTKKLRTTAGEATIKIPRDRNGTYEPAVLKNYENRGPGLETQIITLYGKGNSTREISDFAQSIYGVDVSADMISAITNKIIPLIEEWQSRPLSSVYTVVYLDGVHFKVRENGKIISKCAYIVFGINEIGMKEILGIWIGESESAKFWMRVLNELRNRGVADILIACIDGLSGFTEAIKAVYPQTEIQRCIVHQIRNTTKFIPHKHKKDFCRDLKSVYQAPTEEAGFQALQDMKQAWKPYAPYLESWEKNWPELSTFFVYPPEIRRIIYTTNPIENLNRQLRKVTKQAVIFPHDISLKKRLWLAQRDITKKWSTSIRDWGTIAAQLAIFFPSRFHIS